MSDQDPVYGMLYDAGGAVYNLRHPLLGAAGDGIADDSSAFEDAALLAEVDGVVVPPGRYSIQEDVTFTKAVRIEPGALLVPAAGKTISLTGSVEAGDYPWIDVSAGGAVSALAVASPRWFGAAGDGTTDDTVALQQAFTHAAVVELGAREYLTSSTLSAPRMRIVSDHALIRRVSTTGGDVLSVAGTLGAFEKLNVDAQEGTNVLVFVSTVAASALVPGDLLQITSDKSFVGTHPWAQGELATVYAVSGAAVYLNEVLHDTYLEDDNARVARVSPGTFHVRGTLAVENLPPTPSSSRSGVRLTYCMTPRADIVFRRLTDAGLVLLSCYAPAVRVTAIDHARGDRSEGQPVHVLGSTMYADITGTAARVRHAVGVGAGAGSIGVSWETRVHDFHATAGGQTLVFDAHLATGSITFRDCVAIGGAIASPTEATVATDYAFGLAARESHIRDCHAFRCRGGATVRGGDGENLVLREFTIDGLHLVECDRNGFSFSQPEVTLQYLRVTNLVTRGTQTADTAVVGITGKAIERWSFHQLAGQGHGIFRATSTSSLLPDRLELSDCSAEITPAATTNEPAISIANPSVRVIRCSNVRTVGHGRFLGTTTEVALDLLDLDGCSAIDFRVRAIQLLGACGIVRLAGGEWGEASSTSPVASIFRIDANVGSLEMAPTRVIGSNVLRGVEGVGSPQVGWLQIGGSLGSVTQVVVGLGNVPLELLGGSFQHPRVIRGAGSPTGSVSAPPGTLFLRTDGGAGTTLYVKESGTGGTGWIGK